MDDVQGWRPRMACRPARAVPLPGGECGELPDRLRHLADPEARASRRTVASGHLSHPFGRRRDPSPSRGAIGGEAPDASLRASRLGSARNWNRLTDARLLDGIAGVVIYAHEERGGGFGASRSPASASWSRWIGV